ncbi:hypothetical protein BsWGS_14701 [Bradybaena similaris]
MDFEDWQPPTEAEMKLIQTRRERSDKISKIMSGYLLKGYKMLGSACPSCDTILLQDRQGVKYCIACSELDSDTDKDNPLAAEKMVKHVKFSSSAATSSDVKQKAAAKSTPQGICQQHRSPVGADAVRAKVFSANANATQSQKLLSDESQAQSPHPDHEQIVQGIASAELFIKQEVIDSDPSDTGCPAVEESSTPSVPQQRKRHADTLHERITSPVSDSSSSMVLQVSRLLEKIDWANRQLMDTTSVEYSVQLCLLIKAAAEAVVAVRNTRL